MCHQSPAKILCNVVRITKCLEKKNKSLSITVLPQINIAPEIKPLSFSQCTITIYPVKKCLSLAKMVSVSIPPAMVSRARPSIPMTTYHPYIVEACRLMYGKKPDQLTSEESAHFKGYRQYKIDKGEPIEEDFVYKPDAKFWVLWFHGGHTKSTNNTHFIM